MQSSESVQELVFRESGLLSQEEDVEGSNITLAGIWFDKKTLDAVLHHFRNCGQIWE